MYKILMNYIKALKKDNTIHEYKIIKKEIIQIKTKDFQIYNIFIKNVINEVGKFI